MQLGMNRRRGLILSLAGAMALSWVAGTVAIAEEAKPGKKAETAQSSKAPVTKSAPEKKAAAKSSAVKSAPAKGATPKGPSPRYASAENAAKGQSCFGEAPRIAKITPDEGKAGDKVTIVGQNFGSAACLRSVSFGPGHAATFQLEKDSVITATVPSGGRKGLAMMTVTTASGEDSKPFLVK